MSPFMQLELIFFVFLYFFFFQSGLFTALRWFQQPHKNWPAVNFVALIFISFWLPSPAPHT